MSDTTTATRPPIEAMYVVHRVFRREFGMLPGLVRAVREGDRARARVVGRHLDVVLAQLHIHHTSEDAGLWPRLLDRAGPATALIATVEDQHRGVDAADRRVRSLLDVWTADPRAAAGEELAQAIEELRTGLLEHLELEESAILPLVEEHITAAEWGEMTEHAARSIPVRLAPIVLGMTVEDATPAERALISADMPAVVRLVMRAMGFGLYRRYVDRVRAA